ncbi:MAG: CBS domain-containing protein [Erysipelotrichaceae bacterium]|jgi:CBS domain-containing protein|nr:CBS domain-containing protein [Erysipelotrichaceae bacterium]
MSDNTTIFISLINDFTNRMAEKYQRSSKSTFGDVVLYLKNRDPVIKRYYDEFLSIKELRNYLVHEAPQKEILAAVPSDEIIERFRFLYDKALHPETLSEIMTSEVISFSLDSPLSKVLEVISRDRISQYPVFDSQKFAGLLSDSGIVYWLAAHQKEEQIDLREVSLREAFDSEEHKEYYRILPPDTSVWLAWELYENLLKKGQKSLVILVADKAKINTRQDLVGIVTYRDLLPAVSKT